MEKNIDDAPCTPVEMPEVRKEFITNWDLPGWQIGMQASLSEVHKEVNLKLHVEWEQYALETAELFWVGSEMCDLLYATMPKVPTETKLEYLDLPSRYGMVILAKPWIGVDSHTSENKVQTDCVLWGPAKIDNKVFISLSSYRCLNWENEISTTEKQLAGYMLMGGKEYIHKAAIKDNGELLITRQGKSWLPFGRSDWGVGETLNVAVIPQEYNHISPDFKTKLIASIIDDRQFFAAFCTLLATRSVAEVTETHLPRHLVRRETRRGNRAPSPVKVVYLRQPRHVTAGSGDTEKAKREFSHRWVVSAHMRNQPYGPKRGQHKLILIPAHVKGPDDKPLVVKETVKAWVK